MKLSPRILDEFVRKVGAVLPDDLKKGKEKIEHNVRAVAESVPATGPGYAKGI